MMNLSDPSMALLAAAGGETVKLFDVSVESGDPCTLTYTPSPGSLINSVKWNHTNLVLASAGEDKKISLWRKNGQSMGTIPVTGSDSGDNIEEIILAINFSNKASRYICSGGSGQVVRIWDLQRKRCIKWLKGHTSTITGTMYNCKDEHLASISEGGDLILHNLASGAKAAELKDPNQQVLKVLDYSRISRHLLVTTGDDGSVHLWDTTGRSPKVSWLKQHSAPTSGISFSPANDKVIASVGLDKKLYTYDSGSRRPSFCVAYEAPFSSFAFRDDGWVLAAGTTNGRVVFYDVRAKPQPFTVLRAYSSSEAVTSLCWQRSKAVIINESNCSAETVLLGGAVEDSILMPDPLPSSSSSSVSVATTVSRSTGLSGSTVEGSSSGTAKLSLAEETPQRSHLWPGGTLARLHAPRSSYNFKDDMEVFSPLVDVQPITPSLDKLWDDREGLKKDNLLNDKKPSSFLFPSSRRFNFAEDGNNDHPIFDWKANSASKQDDNRSSFMVLGGITPAPLTKGEESSITPPEAWGGERSSDKLSLRQSINLPSRFGLSTSGSLPSGSMFSGSHDVSSSTSQTVLNSLTNTNLNFSNLRTKDVSSIQETSAGVSEIASSSSMSLLLGVKNIDISGTTSLMPRRFSTYAERISTTSSFSDATSLSVGSPKMKKMGVETREDLLNSFLSRSETSSTLTESGSLPVGGGLLQQHKTLQPESQIGNSFTHQLIKRTFEETVDSFGKPVHEDIRNVHLEVIRQSHMLEVKFSNMMNLILENQAELMKEIKCLRKENQELRRLLP